MANDLRYGAELVVKLVPSESWLADAKEQARAAGGPLELTCPREERVAEVHLRAVLVVPLALTPESQWPAFRVDMGQVMLRGEDGEVRPATIKLMELEARALAKAREAQPGIVPLVMQTLAEAT